MKKVLIVTGYLARNGTETFIMGLYRHIDRTKIQFDFLLDGRAENGYEDEVWGLGATVYVTKYRRRQYFRYRKELNSFFREYASKYDAVYFHGNSFTSVLCLRYAKKYGIPLRMVHSHNTTTTGVHNRLFHKINRRFLPTIANKFFACSEGARIWGYGGTKVFSESSVIKNGIEIEKYRYNASIRETMRKQFNVVDKFVIGMVGRLETEKNVFFAIDVFQKLKSIKKNVALMLVGDGSLKSQLMEYAKHLNLSDSICFLGRRTDVHELLQMFDVMLMPSLFEGFPFVLVEAQAANLPIVLSSTITPEVHLSEPVFFMDLHAAPQEWAEKIVGISYERIDGFVDNRLMEYDVQRNADSFSKMILGE